MSFAPCADKAGVDSTEISLEYSEFEQGHNDSADLCSPLCICHCCHSHLLVQELLKDDLTHDFFSSETNLYSDPLKSGFLFSILQPPRI